MENASKALLIAAGILIGLILITMIIYGHGQISSYYKTKEENKKVEQLAEFNKQYIGYDRDNVRGSDLLSLVNKIVNYNTLNADEEQIDIKIVIQNNLQSREFYYNKTKYYDKYKKLSGVIKFEAHLELNNNVYNPNLEKFLVMANNMEKKYTQGLATKLASNMSTLMGENSRKEPEELFTELKIDASTYGGKETMQKDIWRYYIYQQFKRAHFNCETENGDPGLEYKNGKVKKFIFYFNGTFE